MAKQERARMSAVFYLGVGILLVLTINYFVLYNESARTEIIEFLIPVLEKFLYQPEMDISAIRANVHL